MWTAKEEKILDLLDLGSFGSKRTKKSGTKFQINRDTEMKVNEIIIPIQELKKDGI